MCPECGVDPVWIANQKQKLLESLQIPKLGDEKMLVTLARWAGGISAVRDSILPQVIGTAGMDFLLSFAVCLQTEIKSLASADSDEAVVRGFIEELLSSAISKANFFETFRDPIAPQPRAPGWPYHYQALPMIPDKPKPDCAFKCLQACIEVAHSALTQSILKRLTTFSTPTTNKTDVSQRCSSLLLPLISLLRALKRPVPGIESFCQTTLKFYVESFHAKAEEPEIVGIMDAFAISESSQPLFDILANVTLADQAAILLRTTSLFFPLVSRLHTAGNVPSAGVQNLARFAIRAYLRSVQEPAEPDLKALLDAVIISEDSNILVTEVWPRLTFVIKDRGLADSFLAAMQTRGDEIKLPQDKDVSLHTLSEELMESLMAKVSVPSKEELLSLIEWAYQRQHVSSIGTLLLRLAPLRVTGSATVVNNVLLGSFVDLATLIHKRSLTITAEPYRTFFKNTLNAYTTTVLGPKPADIQPILANIRKMAPCAGCAVCPQLVTFFTSSLDKSIRLHRIGAPKRRHVEQRLATYVGYAAAQWTMIPGSPQGLLVEKKDHFTASSSWNSRRLHVLKILRHIASNEGMVKAILDDSYESFLAATHSLSVNSLTTTTPSLSAGSSDPSSLSARSIPNAQSMGHSLTNPAPGIAGPSGNGSSSAKRPAAPTQVLGRPPKKRKPQGASLDVIDLTSP
ncbi:hypothetical protein HGRIS_009758 [Hohenbuehelia grisea]|uniref:Uncharacterized protein n=1 Tax=Hohenbuehelia grisea TaxID=104357 RepID=A0ABR3J286_9AGAR